VVYVQLQVIIYNHNKVLNNLLRSKKRSRENIRLYRKKEYLNHSLHLETMKL
jgi:hypothetical protein